MSDAEMHLKLDRLLAGQDRLFEQGTIRTESLRILIEGMNGLRDAIQTHTEHIDRLAEAISAEGDGGSLAEEIALIAGTLREIQQDGARMVVLMGRLPDAVAQAAADGAAMGRDGDFPSGNGERG